MFPNDDNFESMVSLESERSGIIEEIPFRMLLLGDWSGDGRKNDFINRNPIEIDRDNFDSIINKLQTKIEIDVFSDGNENLSLEFSELDDFHPDNLYRQVPLFADLRDLRRRLRDPNLFNSAAREVRSWLNSEQKEEVSATPNTVNSDELLDQILSGKSEPVKLQNTQSTELSSLLKDLVKPHLLSFDENEQKSLISMVDEASSDLMRKILHHPKFQQLESAWRGLYFLVRRTETDSDLKIYILDVTKSELISKLKSVDNLSDSDIYRKLVTDTEKMFGGDSWSSVFGNFNFLPNVEEVATLIRFSKICNVLQSPFVSSISAQLLGVESITESPDYSDWNFSEETTIGKLWSTLRSLPESEFIGLTVNRFLTRLPYGFETDQIDSFEFEEFSGNPVHDEYVWANGCFACALLLAASFRKNGWQLRYYLEQDVEGLPIHIYKDGVENLTKSCAEITLTQAGCEKLMDFGLMPLISFRDTDKVKLARFQSITMPVTALKGKWKN